MSLAAKVPADLFPSDFFSKREPVMDLLPTELLTIEEPVVDETCAQKRIWDCVEAKDKKCMFINGKCRPIPQHENNAKTIAFSVYHNFFANEPVSAAMADQYPPTVSVRGREKKKKSRKKPAPVKAPSVKKKTKKTSTKKPRGRS